MTRQAQQTRVTITDVARQAGVSPSAVSAVVPGNQPSTGRVSNATRRRIQTAMDELGYQTNPLARGLRGRPTRSIGVIWSLGGPHLAEPMARDLAMRVQQHGYVTQVADHLADAEAARKLLTDMLQRGVDAVVMQGTSKIVDGPSVVDLLRRFRAAVLVHPFSVSPKLKLDVVRHDRDAAFEQVGRHFAASGCRRPALLTPTGEELDDHKFKAFQAGLEQGGQASPSVMRLVGQDAHEADSPNAAQRVLTARFGDSVPSAPFDGLMCINDQLAAGAIQWLTKRGLDVPGDAAVVGVNDDPMSACFTPALASIDRRDDAVAERVERMLMVRLTDAEHEPQRQCVTMRFRWRASAGGEPPAGEPEPTESLIRHGEGVR